MRLIRGWEKAYLPSQTGGLRLSKAHIYRDQDEEGIGDVREGEIRLPMEILANLERARRIMRDASDLARKRGIDVKEAWWEIMQIPSYVASLPPFVDTTLQSQEGSLSFSDNPMGRVEGDTIVFDINPQEFWEIHPYVTNSEYTDEVGERHIGSPYILCMSDEPTTRSEWEALRASLPRNYDAWTVVDDVSSLMFEIDCGIDRWLKLTGVEEGRVFVTAGRVGYESADIPPTGEGGDIGELALLGYRWLRKGKKYQAQKEYRLMWEVVTPQMLAQPDFIDIELTRTGISLFKTWTPPST